MPKRSGVPKSFSTDKTKKRARGKPFQKGEDARRQPGPGRPKKQESLRAWFREWGNLTGAEAAEVCKMYAAELTKAGNDIPIASLAALRFWMAILNDPDPKSMGLAFDQIDGKVTQPLSVMDWREEARKAGIDPDELHTRLVEQFTAAMVSGSGAGSVASSADASQPAGD